MVEFKKFKVSELFDYKRGKESAPKKVPEGDIPLISETSSNNGFVRGASSTHVFPAKTITVSVNYAQTVFLQPKEFCASVNIIVLVPKFGNVPDAVLLYFVALLRANNGVYDYNYKISKDRLMNTVLLVPVTPAGEPDFEYMTMRIRELEAERIRELEAYLRVTGLNDTTLSVSEAQALTKTAKYKKFKIGASYVIRGHEVLNDENGIFVIKPTKRRINSKDAKVKGPFNYVSRGTTNNGIVSKIQYDPQYLNEDHTLSFAQDTAAIFYQDEPYFTGNKVNVFKLNEKYGKLTDELGLYLCCAIQLAFPDFKWGTLLNIEKIANTDIMLPVTPTGDIDFNYMQNYIRAMEKQTIKGVVEYKDKVIAETKKAVNG